MLSEISVRDVVLIDKLDLDLGGAFNAMTGETGAGKSIILDALGMATGARSDKGLLRKGAQKAQCTAVFTLKPDHAVWQILAEADLDISPREDLVLRRTLNQDGRSRAYINDAPVSAKLLARIGAHVLEVHGQHDDRGLLDMASHRELLDQFGGLSAQIEACAQAYIAQRQAHQTLLELKARQARADEDKAFLEHAIAELDRLAARPNEDELLALERKRLQMSESALEELSTARNILGGEREFETRLAQGLSGLERLRAKLDGDDRSQAALSLDMAIKAIEKSLLEFQEAADAVGQAAQHFTFEPGRLDEVEQRLFALRACARKYDVDVSGLGALRTKFGDSLLEYERFDEDLARAEDALARAVAAYDKIAGDLHRARKKAAHILDEKVARELPALKLENAKFLTQIEATEPGPTGQDKVGFLVQTNPGSPLGPLNKVASGGELSRFALAIKVALAEQSDKVMVFDEIDQGVGGAVADAIGKRLQALAAESQVLVVTHSPQIAAYARHHLKIRKSTIGEDTRTDVFALAKAERLEEIARMLAGAEITDAARRAAQKLLDTV